MKNGELPLWRVLKYMSDERRDRAMATATYPSSDSSEIAAIITGHVETIEFDCYMSSLPMHRWTLYNNGHRLTDEELEA